MILSLSDYQKLIHILYVYQVSFYGSLMSIEPISFQVVVSKWLHDSLMHEKIKGAFLYFPQ